mmetsp:Transcript_5470/g.4656  ORF Transcript_5470/g.4656 Transcript_5470/m.4656 type:complete len:89 (+) Transcript_5470:917-1183(+)
MVKNEKRFDEEKEEKKNQEWRKKLGIDSTMTITYDMLFTPEHKEEFTETQRSMESQSGNISRAKLRIYAEKMGYLKDEKIDINEFLNN